MPTAFDKDSLDHPPQVAADVLRTADGKIVLGAPYLTTACTCKLAGGIHTDDCAKTLALLETQVPSDNRPHFCFAQGDALWCRLKGYCTREYACDN